MPIIESARRLSEYLDRQAVLQKEKRKEKFLTILPTYLERTISGISDEESLYATIPKLSAEMYRYGADIGQQATSILGNLASGKLRELQEKRQKADTESQIGLYQDAFKDIPLSVDGKVGNISDYMESLKGKGYTNEMVAKNIPTLVNANMLKQQGIVENTGQGVFFNQYHVRPSTGERIPGVRYAIDNKRMTMDDTSTEAIEELPLAPEVIDYMTKQKEDDDKFRKQLARSEASQRRTFEFQLERMDEAEKKKFEGQIFVGDGGKYVYPRIQEDKEGNRFVDFFERTEDGKMKKYEGGTPESLTNYSKSGIIKATELDQTRQDAYRVLTDQVVPQISSIEGLKISDIQKKLMSSSDGMRFYADPIKIQAHIKEEYVDQLEKLMPGIGGKFEEGTLTKEDFKGLDKFVSNSEAVDVILAWQDYRKKLKVYDKAADVFSKQVESKLTPETSTQKPTW